MSSSPRCFRSLTSAAEGSSTLRHALGSSVDDAAVVVPELVAGEDLHEAARRARPAGARSGSACRSRASRDRPGRTACCVASLSRDRSSASLAAVCIRAASS